VTLIATGASAGEATGRAAGLRNWPILPVRQVVGWHKSPSETNAP